jgi:Protein of unknown function (DUF4038)
MSFPLIATATIRRWMTTPEAAGSTSTPLIPAESYTLSCCVTITENRRCLLSSLSREGEHNASEVQIRRQAYWSVLCGGFGHVFGNNPIWHFDGPGLYPVNTTWRQAMDLPGSVGTQIRGRLFHSRNWYDLIPDQKHEVVSGGLGEFQGLDYLAPARTSDGNTVIAYMPTNRTVTVGHVHDHR